MVYSHMKEPDLDEGTTIKYVGCIGVRESMKSLNQETRNAVAQESINRLRGGRIDAGQSNLISNNLNDLPDLRDSGTHVRLYSTGTHLKVLREDNDLTLIEHEIRNISIASCDDTGEFFAYIAKKDDSSRACYILDCGKQAQKVLAFISDEFEERKRHLTDQFRPLDVVDRTRVALKDEPWYHGSYLTREESENRLKEDGDFLVRESFFNEEFVLSVMSGEEKVHLIFDSWNQVRTKDRNFKDISDLVRHYNGGGLPLVAGDKVLYLKNGVRPPRGRLTD